MRPTHQSPDGLCIAVALGLATLFSSEAARAIELLDVERSTRITAAYFDAFGLPYTVTTSESDPLGRWYWSSALSGGAPGYQPAAASQDSLVLLAPGSYVVGSSHAELSGTGTVSMGLTYEHAESIYHVLLTLDVMTEYAFAVDNLSPGYPGSHSPLGGFVRLDRVDPGDPNTVLESIQSVTLCRIYDTGEGCPDAAAAGLLDPGTYAFQFELLAPGSHHTDAPATASFSLTLDEIPEPATLALAASGLAVLAAMRKRERGKRR